MIPILALLVVTLSTAPHSAQGTSSVCKDGSTSAAVGRGACSGHGGVDAKATTAAAKAAKSSVTCTDGSTSAGGRGACSSHGGIAKAAAMSKPPAAMSKPAAKADTTVKKGPTAKMATKAPAKAKPKD